MAIYHFRKWENTPTITNDFKLITKLQNFDNFTSKKSVLGYIVNMTDSALTDIYFLKVYYRTAENGAWVYAGDINGNTTSFGTRNFKKIFAVPKKNIVNFQLQIKGRSSGNIAINDITILYRKVRDLSESQL